MTEMRGMHARLDGLTSLVADNPLLAVVAAIGFSVSFQTIAALARAHGLPGWPALYPVGIDVGILALVAESRMLITMKPPRSDVVPRALAWVLAGFTVWANVHGSPASDWLGRGLHAVMPCLWIVFLELTRRRLVASQRADMIPLGRWVAAPLQTPALWQRMHRDDVRSYPLALELEQARLYARDLVRAAPPEHRPPFSSLLRKRVRSGRLPESARRAVRGSLANEYAPGWEDEVTTWVTAALALPAHLAANLENTRAAIAAAPSGGVSGATPETVTKQALEPAPADVPDEPPSMPGTRSEASTKPTAKPALKLAPGKARGMSPEQVADHVEAMLEEYTDVSVNRVKKDLHLGTEKAQQALDIARRRRLSVVVPMERRAKA
jgi:hypothetical protein